MIINTTFLLLLLIRCDLRNVLCHCKNIHAALIKPVKIPREVVNMESVRLTHSEVIHFEIEPVRVSSSVSVDFHEDVVFFGGCQVSRINVTTFEILIK